MAAIAFIIVGMTARGMGDLDVCALEGVLAAAWTIADNRAGRSDGNARRTHGTTGCGSIGIHAVQIVEVSVVPIGAGPIIIVERHRRFGIPDDIADIERIAGIRFPPESVLTDALQDVLSVIDRERRQLRAVVKACLPMTGVVLGISAVVRLMQSSNQYARSVICNASISSNQTCVIWSR